MDIISARWRWLQRGGRRAVAVSAVIGLVTGLAAVGMLSFPAGATSVASTFELDGNPQASNAPGDDWESLLPGGTNTAFAKTAIPIHDFADAPSDTTYFKGGGSKDERDVSLWQHSGTDVAPDKDEIVNAAAAAYSIDDQATGPTGDDDTKKDLVIAFHADRYSNDGDAAIGFWFFKERITLNANGRFNGVHRNGDVLVVSDFNEGEGINTIRVFTWKDGALSEVQVPGSGSKDCQEADHNAFVCATENRANQDNVPSVWSTLYTPKPNVGVPGQYPDFTFLEGGINVSHIVPGTDGCFASFLAETRSSTSTTAQLKDFALGEFPICQPSTTLGSSVSASTIHAGDSVTWTVTETNSGTSPISNVAITDRANAPCTFTYISGDTDNDTILDAAGTGTPAETWTYTCSKTLTATTTLQAYASGTDTVSGKNVTGDPSRCTFSGTPEVGTPLAAYAATTICDPKERASSVVTVISPSTTMATTATASPAIAHAGDKVTFTFYEANDGDVELTNPHLVEETETGCEPSSVLGDDDDPETDFEDTAVNVGDGDGDGKLDPGEEWTFVCETIFSATGAGTVTMIGHGTDPLGVDVTYYTVLDENDEETVCTAGVINSDDELCDPDERASATVTIINPGTILREDVTAVVTFTYYEKNIGDSNITSPYVRSTCAGTGVNATPVTVDIGGTAYNVGDVDPVGADLPDGVLNPGETWQFRCSTTVTIPAADASATFSDTSTGHGTDAAGSPHDNTTSGGGGQSDTSSATITRGKLASSIP